MASFCVNKDHFNLFFLSWICIIVNLSKIKCLNTKYHWALRFSKIQVTRNFNGKILVRILRTGHTAVLKIHQRELRPIQPALIACNIGGMSSQHPCHDEDPLELVQKLNVPANPIAYLIVSYPRTNIGPLGHVKNQDSAPATKQTIVRLHKVNTSKNG